MVKGNADRCHRKIVLLLVGLALQYGVGIYWLINNCRLDLGISCLMLALNVVSWEDPSCPARPPAILDLLP